MRLVDLIDGIIEASKDNRFINFQMDGQVLPIEDYLEVRPENREKLYSLIRQGKIKIGPWYILQDSFLTSGESNVRNLEIGIRKAKELGSPAMIGYFPDTFGNIGQGPQILKKAGINNAYFGRGVKATGFANVVIEDFTSRNSELYWSSPDGSRVLSILFANWYCNGVDMPSDKDLLKNYLDKKIIDMEKYASTRHLLLMNGCDHSPVQKNIGHIIELANSLYKDYEFVHSDLETYADEVEKEVAGEKLNEIKGELRSQNTDGWGTLQGTSSSRYDLKNYNKLVEMRLEEQIQPLYTMMIDKDKYPYEKIDYIYRHLLTNHPHDSICGCSIDSVHDGNLRRFKDCMEALDYLEDQAKIYLSEKLKAPDQADYSFLVVNTTPYYQRKEAEIIIDYDKRYFQGFEYHKIIEELKEIKISELQVYDDKRAYDTYVEDLGVNFGYDLPETSFRKGYYSRQILVKLMVELEPFESRIFSLNKKPGYHEKANILDLKKLETEYYHIQINENASLTITDKRNNKIYKDVLMIEDSGDIGNEYIYKQSYDKKIVKSSEMIECLVQEETTKRFAINIKERLLLPKSADEKLLDEQKYLINIQDRKSERSKDLKELIVNKKILVDKLSPTIEVKIEIDNKIKDHRMRILFGHDLKTDKLYPESIFEVVERPARAPKTWTNPDYSQNFNRFIQVRDQEGGFSVSSLGVQEYEQEDDGLYLSLFRAVGEMGDWGYFETSDSQMQKPMEFNFYLDYFVKDYVSSQQRVLANRVGYFTCQLKKNVGNTPLENKLKLNIASNMFSTLYRNEDREAILRIYNPDHKAHRVSGLDGQIYNIIATEKYQDDKINKDLLDPYEIRTIKMEI